MGSFVIYGLPEGGLRNQGWKDSDDSIHHADGRLAEGSIALCEVQAYVYGARGSLASILHRLGRAEEAEALLEEAARLRERFHAAFWCDPIDTYALALDGDGGGLRREGVQCRPLPLDRDRHPRGRRFHCPGIDGPHQLQRLGRANAG